MTHASLRSWCATFGALLALTAWAQTPEPTSSDSADLVARGAELRAQRDALESGYRQSVRDCYQQFNVTTCRNQARERYIAQHRALRERELAHSALERQERTTAAQTRLQDKQGEAQDRVREAERASEAAQSRQENLQRKQADHGSSASRRNDTLERIEDARAHRADVEQRVQERERNKPRAAPLPSPAGTP